MNDKKNHLIENTLATVFIVAAFLVPICLASFYQFSSSEINFGMPRFFHISIAIDEHGKHLQKANIIYSGLFSYLAIAIGSSWLSFICFSKVKISNIREQSIHKL